VYLQVLPAQNLGTNDGSGSIVGRMKHPKLVWNLNTRQWFCTTCGRTSDDVTEQDARVELDQFDCQLPYVEVLEVLPGEETVRLIKKPFKMEPKKKQD
jgi:hypothetical protein